MKIYRVYEETWAECISWELFYTEKKKAFLIGEMISRKLEIPVIVEEIETDISIEGFSWHGLRQKELGNIKEVGKFGRRKPGDY